jgi:hypothetical protein
MAYVYFDSGYAPGGFLIVADDASPYSDDPSESNLIQWAGKLANAVEQTEQSNVRSVSEQSPT